MTTLFLSANSTESIASVLLTDLETPLVAETPYHRCETKLSHKEDVSLIVVAYIMICFISLNVIMIVHNVVRYLIPLKLKKPFILGFYSLASFQMLGRILELSYIANPSD